MSYAGHSLWVGESYPPAEMQLVYSAAPADWASYTIDIVYPPASEGRVR